MDRRSTSRQEGGMKTGMRLSQIIAFMLGVMAASVLDSLDAVPLAAPGGPAAIRAGSLYGTCIAAGFIAEEIFQRIRGKAEK